MRMVRLDFKGLDIGNNTFNESEVEFSTKEHDSLIKFLSVSVCHPSGVFKRKSHWFVLLLCQLSRTLSPSSAAPQDLLC